MTPLESAIFDLVRSSRGDATPLTILLDEVRIRTEFAETTMHQVELACFALAGQSKIWYGTEGAKLRHQEQARKPQRRLFDE